MKRSATCRTCGCTIRPSARDMSVGAAVRKHYWKHHPEVMLAGQASREWSKKKAPR
ncbi:MAG TPA: hypothetical protein VNE62_11695 [Actinomycetota bacterium]|nr:hypothetical protein [Actinomycetota bacterium]